ncbi:MAG: RluA family pseudouridine synthase [Thermoanaerobaculia bacterium]
MSPESWRIDVGETGIRLDRALASRLDLPRNQIQEWIRSGNITLDGVTLPKPGHLLRKGELVLWTRPATVESRVIAEAGDLQILGLDDDFIVLDKPAGLTVHPGAGQSTGTLVHRLLSRFPELAGVGGPGRPGIVHRLDKGTSGVMVVARTGAAYRALSSGFASRRMDKRYLAIVHGVPKEPHGTIEAAIGRHAQERKRMTVRADGRVAITRYRTLASAPGVSLLELTLLTGRTHQIRVHLKHLRHPIVGDPTYGEARHRGLPVQIAKILAGFPRPALHAWRLRFEHPTGEGAVEFEAPLPEDMTTLWRTLAGTEVLLPER